MLTWSGFALADSKKMWPLFLRNSQAGQEDKEKTKKQRLQMSGDQGCAREAEEGIKLTRKVGSNSGMPTMYLVVCLHYLI